MNRITIIYFLSIFSIVTYSQETNQTIDSLISETIIKYNIPAISASLVTLDTCFYGIGGTTKIYGKDTVNLKNKFHLGSNTKAITSLIAMKMVENNQIKLSTTFVELFPELKNKIDRKYRNITLSDLLSHNAKIQPYTSGAEYQKLPELTGSISDKRYSFARFILNEKPVIKGTYSNAGYTLVSLMLEKKSEKTFEELIEDTMNELNLDYFIGFPNKENNFNPWGHWKENGELIALEPNHFYKLKDYMSSAGGISMNIIDYSKLVQLHLKGLNGKTNYLKSESYQILHYGFDNYSFGWGNSEINGNKVSFHDGSAGTYFCHTILIPEKKVAIIIMMNSADKSQRKGGYELRELILKNRNKYGN